MPTLIEQLQPQCITPDVLNEIRIERYLQVAAQMYAVALEPNVLTVRYVSLKKFLGFMTKLYAHNGYAAAAVRKQRLYFEQSMRTSISALEQVVADLKMLEEAQKEATATAHALPAGRAVQAANVHLTEEDLFDEFEENTLSVPAPAVVPTAAATVAQPRTMRRAFDRLRVPESVMAVAPAVRMPLVHLPPRPALAPAPAAAASSSVSASAPTAPDSYLEFTALSAGTAGYAENAEVESHMPGVSSTDVALLQALGASIYQVDAGQPFSSVMQYPTPLSQPAAAHMHGCGEGRVKPSPTGGGAGAGGGPWFVRDDYYVNYTSVLRHVSPALQMARPAVESNRCFFLHLGIAISINPFALQVACRHLATQLLLDTQSDDFSLRADILPSVLGYAHFVDANALIWLWLQEFSPYQICLLSGTPAHPIVSVFRTRGAPLHKLSDVIIHCDGSHFTLLRPFSPTHGAGGWKQEQGQGLGLGQGSSVPLLLQAVAARGGLVQEHELDVRRDHSVSAVLAAVFG